MTEVAMHFIEMINSAKNSPVKGAMDEHMTY